jgi:hypothetical protein
VNSKIEDFIEGSEKLTALVGAWPHCHDAEVIEVYLYRGGFTTQAHNEWNLPSLTIKMILWEGSAARNPDGTIEYLEATVAVLRFEEVEEFSLEGFNWQNPIQLLDITALPDQPQKFKINFESIAKPGDSFAMALNFSCSAVRVLDAGKWPFNKRVRPWFTDSQFTIVRP